MSTSTVVGGTVRMGVKWLMAFLGRKADFRATVEEEKAFLSRKREEEEEGLWASHNLCYCFWTILDHSRWNNRSWNCRKTK